jgi:hypothetical protein
MVAHVYAEGKCVACGKAEQKTENFTEMDVTVGEKVVGQWYRMYRSAEGLYDGFTISCTVNGIASQEQVSETTTLSFGVLPKSATEGQNAFVIFPGHGSPEFIEGVEIYVTEDYIEIFLPEGLEIPFKWVSGSTTIFDCVYTITADSSITEILFSSTVKRMVMSE